MAAVLSTRTVSSGSLCSSPSEMSVAPSMPRTISATSAAAVRSASMSSPSMFMEMPSPLSMEMSMELVCTDSSSPPVSSAEMSSATWAFSRSISSLSSM